MLRNLQLLRALAATMVVIGHLQRLLVRADPQLAWVILGHAGVDLFFVISGFVMVYTTDRSEPGPGAFAWRRLVRIAPVYWLATLGVFVLALVAPQLLNASRPDPLWLVKSMAFVPFDKGDGTMAPLMPVGWTLNYEMFFYATLALSLFAGARLRYWICGAAILGLSLVGFSKAQVSGVAATFYTRPIMAEFVLGMAIGCVFDRLPRARGAWGVASLLAGAACLIVLVLSGLTADEPLRVAMAAPAAGGVVIVALMLERGGWRLRTGGLLLVGDASYSLYLTHIYVTQAVGLALTATHLTSPAAIYAAALIALVAAIAIAIVVNRLVEVPASRALKSLARRRFGPVLQPGE